MKNKEFILLVAICVGFITNNFAQHPNYRITNGIGIHGGISKFDIITDNFVTQKGNGFLGGLTATVDIPNRWYNMSFGMQLSENHFDILGRPSSTSTEQQFLEYKLFAAQIALLGHIKLVQKYVTIDLGPMVQYNGKLELIENGQEGFYINNYQNLLAKDITNISQFNVNAAIGASAGYGFFRLKVQYIYGLTNTLNKLNSQNIDKSGNNKNFKGNQSMLVLGAMIVF